MRPRTPREGEGTLTELDRRALCFSRHLLGDSGAKGQSSGQREIRLEPLPMLREGVSGLPAACVGSQGTLCTAETEAKGSKQASKQDNQEGGDCQALGCRRPQRPQGSPGAAWRVEQNGGCGDSCSQGGTRAAGASENAGRLCELCGSLGGSN